MLLSCPSFAKEIKSPGTIAHGKVSQIESSSPLLPSQEMIIKEPSSGHTSSEEVIVRSSKDPSVSSAVVKDSSTSVREQLEELGAWGVSTGGVAGRLEVQVRGGGGHQSGLYLDDIPLHSFRAKAMDLNLLAVDLLEKVEVKHGGSGAINGSGAMSGSLHFQTSDPHNMRFDQRFKVGGGTQGFAQASVLTKIPLTPSTQGMFALSVSGGPHQFAYVDQYGLSKRRKYSSFSRLSGLSKIVGEVSQWSISMLLGSGRIERGEPGPEPLALEGRRSDQRAHFLSLTINSPHYSLGEAWFKLKLNQSIFSFRYLFQEANPLWQSRQSAKSDFQDFRSTSNATLNIRWSSIKASIYSEFSETHAFVNDREVQRLQGALSPRLQWSVSPFIECKVAYRLDLNDERSLQTIPTMSAEWHTLGQRPWRLWLGGSLVWRDPGFDERYLNGPGLIPNPLLKPERGGWAELGIKKSYKRIISKTELRLSTAFKLFSQKYEQLISYVPIDPYRLRAENLDGAVIEGVESSFKLSLRKGQLKGTLDGVGSVIKHKLLQTPYAPLPLRPQRFGSMKLSIIQRRSRDQIEGWVRVVTRGRVTTDRFGDRALPARSLYSLGLTRYWNREWRWYLTTKLVNLFNTSSYDFALHPIAGRSIWVAFGIDR